MRLAEGRLLLSPSDLSAYLACPHLTTLELEVAQKQRTRPHTREALAQLVAEKGDLHEARYLAHLQGQGLKVEVIGLPDDSDGFTAAHRATVAAMQSGAEVIYQATFSRKEWRGRADFLLRVDVPSQLGSWSYEPYDAKLARTSKPSAVLQLAWYAGEIAVVQGRLPDRVHVVLGTNDIESFNPTEVGAYLRLAQARLRAHATNTPDTYPWPCEHCARCDFALSCREQWVTDDHLTRVASIRRDQIRKLEMAGVHTLTALAETPADLRVRRLAPAMRDKLRDQAALQTHRYRTGELRYRLLVPENRRGLGLLPAPSLGDVFFDMEGDPFFDPKASLEFLFGVAWSQPDGQVTYQPFWARDRASERVAFEEFVDFVVARRQRHPDMHVYHYATYEPATLARLMGTHATREDQIDQLLRDGVFVDLLQAVRQGLRAGVESYSLKEVEKLFFTRQAEVSSGNEAMIEFERWLDDADDRRLDAIAEYNREDCLATLALRDWLLDRIPEAELEHGVEIPFALTAKELEPDSEKAFDATGGLRSALLEDSPGNDARRLCAYLLDYHRREARPGWWWYFRRMRMVDEELADDGEALGLLEHDGMQPLDLSLTNRRSRSLEWTFTFPPQQHHFDEGDGGVDPREDGTGWSVSSIDDASGVIRLRRGRDLQSAPLPTALVPKGPLPTDEQQEALRRFGRSMLESSGRYPHLERLVARTPPLDGSPLQCTDLQDQRTLLDELENSYLVVQGPPGSGKTYRGARLISHLLAQGKRVGVTAQSHKVIHNMLEEIERVATEEGLTFKGVKRGDSWTSPHIRTSGRITDVLDPSVTLVAGTSWLFARADLDATLDTLVVDEAGQFSLADTIACGTAAHRIVLLGDQLQLSQVVQGFHPEGSAASALEHVLGEHQTIPENMGVFLKETRRMHPEICRFTSDVFYEGRLASLPSCAERSTSDGVGVRWLRVEHEGNRVDSEEEAITIAAEIDRLAQHTFRSHAGERPLRHEDMLVVAPYNAQVRLLRERLPDGVEVGTVDKFQGREAPVVFYSMASSSGEDIPRGLDFLLSRNRLNVAVSRAQCLAYVACSPRLLEVSCRTVEHLRLANALCRYVELAASPAAAVEDDFAAGAQG